MIGNDIVDLKLAAVQSNWRRKGFLKKIFTSNEQSMIFESRQPDLLVWKLWSMKESAYKARLRVQERIRFDPRSFDCHILDENEGKVSCEGKMYHTISKIKDDCIDTYAYSDQFEIHLYQGTIGINQTCLRQAGFRPYKALYAAVISLVALRTTWKENDLMITKNELGIPEIYRNNQKTSILCSLSHHGRYGSFITTC